MRQKAKASETTDTAFLRRRTYNYVRASKLVARYHHLNVLQQLSVPRKPYQSTNNTVIEQHQQTYSNVTWHHSVASTFRPCGNISN
jgi:hypothetical protein